MSCKHFSIANVQITSVEGQGGARLSLSAPSAEAAQCWKLRSLLLLRWVVINSIFPFCFKTVRANQNFFPSCARVVSSQAVGRVRVEFQALASDQLAFCCQQGGGGRGQGADGQVTSFFCAFFLVSRVEWGESAAWQDVRNSPLDVSKSRPSQGKLLMRRSGEWRRADEQRKYTTVMSGGTREIPFWNVWQWFKEIFSSDFQMLAVFSRTRLKKTPAWDSIVSFIFWFFCQAAIFNIFYGVSSTVMCYQNLTLFPHLNKVFLRRKMRNCWVT